MSERMKRRLLEYFRTRKMAAKHRIAEKPFDVQFLQTLDPVEAREVSPSISELRDDGYLGFDYPLANPHSVGVYFLTEKGEQFIYSDAFNPDKKNASSMTVNHININAQSNIQIGDNNSQQIVNSFQILSKAIEDSEASHEEKLESKSLLVKIAENPLISSLLTGVGSAAIKSVLGIS